MVMLRIFCLRDYRANGLQVVSEQEVAHELLAQTSQNTTVQKHPHGALHTLPLKLWPGATVAASVRWQ
jgi:hypothetical protein